MDDLVRKWRDEAGSSEHGATLERCAAELQQAWHDYAHDAEYDRECPLCRAEIREHGDGLGNHDTLSLTPWFGDLTIEGWY